MHDLSELLKAGWHFCKKPLIPEAAQCGTMEIRITGTNICSGPIAIVCRQESKTRETPKEVHH